jgi:prepilin-type N-terminal cleavage/methylation domain-containing protein
MRSGSTGLPVASRWFRRLEGGAPQCASQQGFSLLEALAALVILVMGLSSLYSAFNSALGAAGRADAHVAAMHLAQSLMDQHSAPRVFRAGTMRGRQDQFTWTLDVTPADEEIAPSAQPGSWQLLRLTVTVMWPRQRRFQLETLQLARLQ